MKTSVPYLRIDAQFTVIEAALKGCLKWLVASGDPKTVSLSLLSVVNIYRMTRSMNMKS